MELIMGLHIKGKNKVCKLNKFIRPKQVSRQWFSKFSDVLINSGFIQQKSDYCLSLTRKEICFGFTCLCG